MISERLSHVHRDFLEKIIQRKGGKRTFLVKPAQVKVNLELPNLTVLEGSFEDLPLKDQSLDGMVVVDIQDAANLKACVREFRRVLRQGGVVCTRSRLAPWRAVP